MTRLAEHFGSQGEEAIEQASDMPRWRRHLVRSWNGQGGSFEALYAGGLAFGDAMYAPGAKTFERLARALHEAQQELRPIDVRPELRSMGPSEKP